MLSLLNENKKLNVCDGNTVLWKLFLFFIDKEYYSEERKVQSFIVEK